MAGPYGTLRADKLEWWDPTLDNGNGDNRTHTLDDIALKATVDSQEFTGNVILPTATTVTSSPAANDSSTKLATTEYVQTELVDYAPKLDPVFTGTVAIPNIADVETAITGKADLTGDTFTGDVTVTGDITAVDLTLSGDLTVNGTQTILNTATLEVEDKNIVIAKGSTTDAAADGGGITLKGTTDKTILWSDTSDSWEFNQPIRDPKGDVRKIPQEDTRADLATDHVLVVDNAGEHLVFQPTADYVAGSPHTGTKVTVNTGVFAAGDAVTIINHSAYTLFIEKGTVSNMYNAADATDTSRTLAAHGMATLLFTAANTAYISGAGLS